MPFPTTVNIGGSSLFRHLQVQVAEYLVRRPGELIYENGTAVPVAGLLTGGERYVNQPEVREFGEANLSAPGADDIPLVEISATENEYRVFKAEAAFAITFDEEMGYLQARANGHNIPVYDIKFGAAVRVIRERLDRAIAFGDPALNFTGAVNDASVPVSDETATNILDGSMTAYQLREFLMQPMSDIDDSTEAVEGANAMLMELSPKLYNLADRKMLDNQGFSVLRSLQDSGRIVVKSRRLSAANLAANGVTLSSATTERFVVRPRDTLALNRRAKAPALYPADYVYSRGNRKVYPMYAMTSETMINYPLSMRYVDYETA